MKMIILDIDGTIVDAVHADDKCFIQTFKEIYQIDLANADWNEFIHVTDNGLTIEIFEQHFSQYPKKADIQTVKSHFKKLLKECVQQFTEIRGAISFIESASNNTDFEIAFATGGWKETAVLKCQSIGLHLNEFICKSANDHYNRAKIIELAIEEALEKNNLQNFESVTYFGDGTWDFDTTRTLGINFIGVDCNNNGILKKRGAKKVIPNFIASDKIWRWLLV